ncbi:hypothetical protein FRIGORI9N_40068 [Frigoribacterium sp. 9N]|nr:hypothetical protein FRIGORI9N_40068 [Frigoribacterium sp. 9N]
MLPSADDAEPSVACANAPHSSAAYLPTPRVAISRYSCIPLRLSTAPCRLGFADYGTPRAQRNRSIANTLFIARPGFFLNGEDVSNLIRRAATQGGHCRTHPCRRSVESCFPCRTARRSATAIALRR